MRSLNGIGLGLSLTFGCLMLALMGEIYYLLWWKRRRVYRESTSECCSSSISRNSAREFMYMFCCKKSANTRLMSSTVSLTDRFQQQSNIIGSINNMNFLIKPDEAVSDGFMGFRDLTGPPRNLFTIKEESREDLESEDGEVSARSLSDVAHSFEIETPYLTPLSSPSMFTPPLTPMDSSYTHLGFNPLFESSNDAEFSKLKASPPQKFKFLQEEEDKFQTRIMVEAAAKGDHYSDGCAQYEGKIPERGKIVDRDESFITIIIAEGNRSHRG